MDHQEAHGRPAADKSLVALFTDLFREATALLSGEIQLARTEIGDKVSQVGTGTVALGAAYLLLSTGFLVLLLCCVYALELAWPAWAAALLVGGVTFIIGLFFLGGAVSKLKARSLAPQASAASLRRDTQFIKEHIQ
jgi:hypothetical protein